MSTTAQNRKATQIVKKLDRFNVVWFENGNQYIGFKYPAFRVYISRLEGLDREKTAEQCSAEYQVPLTKSRRFVNEIFDRIESVEQWKAGAVPIPETKRSIQPYQPYSIHYYRINGKNLCFRYGTKFHEYMIHPLLEHLGADTESSECSVFELFGKRNKYLLRVNNQMQGIWNKDETHLMKGKLFQQILNVVYDKKQEDWMAIFHASAVTNGAKTIIFAAAPGSGKSTIAALLHQSGYELVADDFVAIESESLNAYPFQLALSIKEGSRELLSGLYSGLKEKNLSQYHRKGKVQYLPLEVLTHPAPVYEVVFIKYDIHHSFSMKKLQQDKALKMLLDETWTSGIPENATRFLDWYEGINCYRLCYSDTEKALNAIFEFFEL